MNWDFNRMIEDEILSKPVAKSLEEINHYDEIMGIEGACGKHKSFFPFSVKLASRKYLCRATEIHKYCSLISKPYTKEWFDAAFEGVPASEEIKEASKRICHSYSISGQSDPGYIANVIVACLANANTKKFEGIKYPI